LLKAFERHQLHGAAVVDRLARVAVFVDEAVGRPGEIVFERVRRELRQGAYPHMELTQRVELLRQVMPDDRDEARRQAALRHESDLRAGSDFAHGAGGGDILGKIEIMHAGFRTGFGHARIEEEGQSRDHRLLALHRAEQCVSVGDVDLLGFSPIAGGLGQESLVGVGEGDLVIAGRVQEIDDGAADFASAENENFASGHEILLRKRVSPVTSPFARLA
jgi:hypothetical protein